MDNSDFVSLWIGNINSKDHLDLYTELKYTDEGEWLPSPFLADFNIDIDDFDEDFLEKAYHENEVDSLKDLILGCSYESIVIPKLVSLFSNKLPRKVNSAILMYNLKYSGSIKEIKHDEINFKYVGTLQYR